MLSTVLLFPMACGPAQPTVNGNDAVVGCGDGVAAGWEECDQEDLREADCTTFGLAGGTLACSRSCTYDTSGCQGCGNGVCDADEDRVTCAEDCGARQIATGGLVSCSILGTGDAFCWGNGASGMIGDGTFTANSLASMVVGGLSHQALSAGAGHMCSLTPAGLVYCWGNGEYLGAPNLEDTSVPRVVEGIPQVSSLSASYWATCALGLLGEVICWGIDSNVTTRGMDRSPGPVQGLSSGMRIVSCGGMHCCALSAPEDLWCWGRNESGVLGVPGT
ncbi:MAG: hypothetical protein RBU30_22815, partial [Polyangia bacterium]|nr:hypothetical protein [Polyangia bacterium]